ncbi:MAG: hypothetical protein JW760_01665 [Spirochaetales bacterium]|nr:hypothetical protein [Spirochaetales bacterium]
MEIRDPRSVGRSSTCPDCGKDLKICLNCDFYDQNAHWECRESISERVAEKDRGNFCDFFRFSGKPFAGNSGKDDKAYKARSDLKNLFGDE